MSEKIKEYGKKSITYTELAEFVGGFCRQKIFENGHKDNPLTNDFSYFDKRIQDEYKEFVDSFYVWRNNPTEENRKKVLMEIADIGNFWMFLAGKIAGYSELERR